MVLQRIFTRIATQVCFFLSLSKKADRYSPSEISLLKEVVTAWTNSMDAKNTADKGALFVIVRRLITNW
jgi:hypothetical protein